MKPSQLRKLLSKKADRKRLFYGTILTLAASMTGLACAWSSFDDHSVRFNYERTGRGFYRLPPLPIVVDPKKEKELSTRQVEQFDYDLNDSDTVDGAPQTADSDQRTKWDEVWLQAESAIEKGDLSDAGTLLRKYLDMTSLPTPEYGVGSSQNSYEYRNSANDMLDALTALQQGSSRKAVKAYLEARAEVTNSVLTGEEFDEVLKKAIPDANLSDNWAYLMDAQLTRVKDNTERALEAFQKHGVDFPASEKHEAVLFMIARLTMRQSYSSAAKGCYIEKPTDREEANYRQTDKVAIEPKEKCQDESWHMAIKAFRQQIKKYPHGRYVNDARGWIANLYLNGEETALALAEYYRLLGSTDLGARLEAKKSLQIIGHEYDDETLYKVEELIADDPNASQAYAYHRIYNVAIDHSYQTMNTWCCYGDDKWQQEQDEKKRVADETEIGNHELERVARFATAMMKRYPKSSVSGDFVLRTAEAQLELQNFAEALRLSDKALNMGIQGEMRMEGLWVRGSSEHRLKQLRSARATFKQLIAEFPKAKLTEGARRLLAMTAEDQDDLETALELYIELKYEQDVAYFIDVLLPTDRLAKFIDSSKNISQYNQLLYALGVRYMRDKRWNEARETLRRVGTEKGTDSYLQYDRNATWYFAKEPDYYEDRKNVYIKTSWVIQDLKTIDILEYYENAVENAESDENKAETMYQLASRLFESDDLAFYNPAAWNGIRGGSLSQLPFSDHERLLNETRIIFEHLQAHDPWARSIPIYLEIADRFPQTKTARDALYSAAVAHQRLSERNGPWGVFYQRGLFAGSRMVTYADVKGTYPDYQLPRGTYGWEPSTRTVNSGPGWAPKPTPAPKLTRTQNFERKFKRYFGAAEGWVTPKLLAVTDGYATYVRGWFDALLAAVGILLAGYLILLGFHFRLYLSAAIIRLIYPETPQEILPDSESRLEKVIGDDTP